MTNRKVLTKYRHGAEKTGDTTGVKTESGDVANGGKTIRSGETNEVGDSEERY